MEYKVQRITKNTKIEAEGDNETTHKTVLEATAGYDKIVITEYGATTQFKHGDIFELKPLSTQKSLEDE